KDAGVIYGDLARQYGDAAYARIDASATPEQKKILAGLSARDIKEKELAGEKILRMLTTGPGTSNPIGGIKAESESGWFAARPSGTENVYKLYAESFKGAERLAAIQGEA